MDEATKIVKIIEEEFTHWNNAQLHEALDYCERRYEETHNVFWGQLRQMVELEIMDRGGRR